MGIRRIFGGIIMSCYIRYMKDTLKEIDIEPETKEERKHIDLTIRGIIGKKEDDKCNIVWKEVKNWLQKPKRRMN